MAAKLKTNKKQNSISNESILLTGGTGSFGAEFVNTLLKSKSFGGIIRVFSRDEYKQHLLQKKFKDDPRLRFFIGDVRDRDRLIRAMNNVDIVVHAAALKQVPALEYNPFEAVKTNILGTQNVIDAVLDTDVKKAILISSDKAVNPVNLYGATKLVAEKLFIQSNSYVGAKPTSFSVVRYGNVAGSRGSVIPYFYEQAKKNMLTITDERMTRFWITLPEGVRFVLDSLTRMRGGEIFVPKIPSVKIIELARVIAPKAKLKITGVRPGEKIHEILIGIDEARHTKDMGNYFVIEPEFHWWTENNNKGGEMLEDLFSYSSENNPVWLSSEKLKEILYKLMIES